MSQKSNIPFRADHVGSLPRPEWLLDARDNKAAGKISAEELREIENKAIAEVAGWEEGLGLKGITDGEYRRALWHMDFLSQIGNVSVGEGRFVVGSDKSDSTGFRPQCIVTKGKLSRPKGIQTDDFKYLKSVVKQTPKVCVPSPTLMHFRGGRDAVDTTAYPTMDMFFADVAKVYNDEFKDLANLGLKYLQIDDTNLAYLCDSNIRGEISGVGENPDALLDTYIKLINDSVAGLPDDMTVCLHMCRGNFGRLSKGSYEPVADKLFNTLNVDGFFLEYDDERSGDFAPLRFVPKNKRVVLGLLTTKDPKVEDAEPVKKRIDQAAKYLPLDNLCVSAQCGFGTGAGRQPNRRRQDPTRKFCSIDDTKAKIGRIVEVARDVWGTV
jgi:5-methyltetrahydropteroyltriglutamate--homocysteine methyltransferase